MTFLDKLLLGKSLPAHTDTSHFPSNTYRARRCLKKHCNETCFIKKDFEWEFWAFFLSEKEVQRTQIVKKIKNMNNSLRLSVWYKLSGARNVSAKMNQHIDIHKSDRKLVDFILGICRKRSVSEIVSKNNVEKNIFLVYRNIFDLFYKDKIKNNNEGTKKEDAKISEKNNDENVKKDNETIDFVKAIKNDVDKVINDGIYTSDPVDEELVFLIDYLFKKDHSNSENVFKLLYIFFMRLGFDKLFLCDITNKSDIAKSLNSDYYSKLQKTTKFEFIKVFIRYLLENDTEMLDRMLDLSLCFSASSFCEMLGFIIKHSEAEIVKILNNKDLDYQIHTGDDNNEKNIENKKIKSFRNELLEAHERIRSKSLQSNSIEKETVEDIKTDVYVTKKEKQDDINTLIAKVLYTYLSKNTNEKLEQMRTNLKPQKIDALEIEDCEIQKNEDYFDFLVVQNESVKAQVGIKSDLANKLDLKNQENEKLMLQNINLKENIKTLETELKEFEHEYLAELKKMLAEANKKNALLEEENKKLKNINDKT